MRCKQNIATIFDLCPTSIPSIMEAIFSRGSNIGDNLLRAGLSIANNLAEGNGKKSKKEKQRYFGTSLDSTRECISVFNVFKRQKLITDNKFLEVRSDGREITGMIHNLIGSLD